jgi:predicted Fe-Mo cluster-binding NifX family protein
MKIFFPVEANDGMGSIVHGHFGSAKRLLIYDTESKAFEEHQNLDRGHVQGACQPMKALGGRMVDAVIVGGIGSGALTGLSLSGLKVYRAEGITVARNLESFQEGNLKEITPGDVCGGHSHSCGAGHGS